MMTLEEAIKHAYEVAVMTDCEECRKDHEQLAVWMEELWQRQKDDAIARRGEIAISRWIPCSERLPDTIKPVYITWHNPLINYTDTGFAHYFEGDWYWYSSASEDVLSEYGEYDDIVEVDVLAWMPMPDAYEPPEAEKKDDDKR